MVTRSPRSHAWILLGLCGAPWACGGETGPVDAYDTGGTPATRATGGTTMTSTYQAFPSIATGGARYIQTNTNGGASKTSNAQGGQAARVTSAMGGHAIVSSGESECSSMLVGRSCVATDSCTWSDLEHCAQGGCECHDGLWACSSALITPCGTCPLAQSIRCGASCTGAASACLCACNGGDDFTLCSCEGGIWKRNP
jgi:hypothetical protein